MGPARMMCTGQALCCDPSGQGHLEKELRGGAGPGVEAPPPFFLHGPRGVLQPWSWQATGLGPAGELSFLGGGACSVPGQD